MSYLYKSIVYGFKIWNTYRSSIVPILLNSFIVERTEVNIHMKQVPPTEWVQFKVISKLLYDQYLSCILYFSPKKYFVKNLELSGRLTKDNKFLKRFKIKRSNTCI